MYNRIKKINFKELKSYFHFNPIILMLSTFLIYGLVFIQNSLEKRKVSFLKEISRFSSKTIFTNDVDFIKMDDNIFVRRIEFLNPKSVKINVLTNRYYDKETHEIEIKCMDNKIKDSY